MSNRGPENGHPLYSDILPWAYFLEIPVITTKSFINTVRTRFGQNHRNLDLSFFSIVEESNLFLACFFRQTKCLNFACPNLILQDGVQVFDFNISTCPRIRGGPIMDSRGLADLAVCRKSQCLNLLYFQLLQRLRRTETGEPVTTRNGKRRNRGMVPASPSSSSTTHSKSGRKNTTCLSDVSPILLQR